MHVQRYWPESPLYLGFSTVSVPGLRLKLFSARTPLFFRAFLSSLLGHSQDQDIQKRQLPIGWKLAGTVQGPHRWVSLFSQARVPHLANVLSLFFWWPWKAWAEAFPGSQVVFCIRLNVYKKNFYLSQGYCLSSASLHIISCWSSHFSIPQKCMHCCVFLCYEISAWGRAIETHKCFPIFESQSQHTGS